jgi:hypothetical protein
MSDSFDHFGRQHQGIDQANIADDLPCLPIFLAGCNRLLITCGSTYTSRLWCCVELFVYVTMMRGGMNIAMPTISILGSTDDEKTAIRNRWFCFDANQCECFSPTDKERIFGVLEQCDGGVPKFNEHIQHLARELFSGVIYSNNSGAAVQAGARVFHSKSANGGESRPQSLPQLLAPSPSSAKISRKFFFQKNLAKFSLEKPMRPSENS